MHTVTTTGSPTNGPNAPTPPPPVLLDLALPHGLVGARVVSAGAPRGCSAPAPRVRLPVLPPVACWISDASDGDGEQLLLLCDHG